MIQLTPAAVRQILAAADEAGMEEALLRVAARTDGEGGAVEFGMGFDDRREQDEEILCDGVIVLVSPPSRAALEAVILDYVELSPGEFRFVFGQAGS
jgi:iron-sulfur cluster assembly protein